MLGSLRKVWPWKITLESEIIESKEYVIREENVWPTYNIDSGLAVIIMIIGFFVVIFLDRKSRKSYLG